MYAASDNRDYGYEGYEVTRLRGLCLRKGVSPKSKMTDLELHEPDSFALRFDSHDDALNFATAIGLMVPCLLV